MRIGRSGKNQIRHFEITDRPIIRRGLGINLFRDPIRCFADLIVRSYVAHDRRINSISINDHRIIACLARILSMRERAGNHDVGIGHSD